MEEVHAFKDNLQARPPLKTTTKTTNNIVRASEQT